MPDTYSKLGQTDLTQVGSTTVGAGVAKEIVIAGADKVIVKHIRAVNQSTANSTALRIWHTTSGGVVSDDGSVDRLDSFADSLILPTADISEGGWAEFEGTIILNPGESLYAAKENSTVLTTADISITAYGLRMS